MRARAKQKHAVVEVVELWVSKYGKSVSAAAVPAKPAIHMILRDASSDAPRPRMEAAMLGTASLARVATMCGSMRWSLASAAERTRTSA